MTWTRLSDDFADHPDLLDVSRSARLLHVEALVYSNRHGNDGRFRRSLVARMTDAEDWPDLVDELVKRDVWADVGDNLLQIDWSAWGQEPADAVRERREANAKVNREYRERGKRHRAGDHSMCTDSCPAVREQSRDPSRETSRDGSRDLYPSRPLLSRPKETGERGGRTPAGRSARATQPPGTTPPGRGTTPWDHGVHPTVTVRSTPRS